MTTITLEHEAVDPGSAVGIGAGRAELAVREESGITVRLLWIRGTDIVLVSVADRRNAESFELVLEPGERALDVFHHPYAYASARGLEIKPPRPEFAEELVDV
jgi:hypothetical protein